MSTKAESEKTETSSAGKIGAFLQKNLNKGELALKHAIGLGQTPNVVPVGEPGRGEARNVEIGWHPVGGLAGKWFAERTGLGKLITEKINKYPDPTQHWAVLVGDFVHQLWMDENFDVIYINEKIKREEWTTFEVGQTHLNDDAVRRAGEAVIATIREKQPGYNLISNNCQTYALQLLDTIKAGGKHEFGTTLAVYERVFGKGKVMDLFEDPETGVPIAAVPPADGVPPAPVAEGENPPVPPEKKEDDKTTEEKKDDDKTEEKKDDDKTNEEKKDDDEKKDDGNIVSFAQNLMNKYTNQLDTQEQANASREAPDQKDKLRDAKKKVLGFFKRK